MAAPPGLASQQLMGQTCKARSSWAVPVMQALQGLLRQPLPWSQSFSAVPAFVSGSVARECCSMRPDPHARRTCLHQCLRLHPRRLAAAALPGLLLLSVDTKQTSILLRAPLSTASAALSMRMACASARRVLFISSSSCACRIGHAVDLFRSLQPMTTRYSK